MAETKVVKIINGNRFEPQNVTIAVGDTVKWINESNLTHTVTRDDGEPLFDSGNLAPNGEFEFTFSTPSDDTGFFYYCKIHGRRMSGNVIVKPPVSAEPTVVKMLGTRFEPQNVTIAVGDTVKWVNESNLTHTVTRDDGEPLFDSGNLAPNGEFEFTFSTPSDDTGFFYYCKIHGRRMSGNVIVKPPVSAEPTVVKMLGTRFEPQNVTIAVGDTVKWVNESNLTHTVTRDDGEPLFDSGNLAPNGEFKFTFSDSSDGTGLFYYCKIHGRRMSGNVIVQPAAENSPES